MAANDLGRLGGGIAIAKVAALVMQTVHFALLARAVSVDTFGAVMGSLSLLFIIGAIAELGLTNAAVLAMSQGRSEAVTFRATLRASGTMVVLGAVLAAAIALILFRGETRLVTFVLLPWLVLSNIDIPWIAVHQHRLDTHRIATAEVVSRAALVVSIIPLLLFPDWNPRTEILVVGAGFLVSEIVSFAFVVRGVPRKASVDREVLREVMRTALPIGLTNASGVVHYRSDQVVMATMGRQEGLAGYSVASKVNEAVLAVANAIGMVTFPSLARQGHARRVEISRSFTRLASLGVLLGGPVVFFGAPLLVTILGGDGFFDAMDLVRILTPALMASVMNVSIAQFLIVEYRAPLLFRLSMLAGAINIALTVVLVLRFDAFGAAWATTLTEVLGFLAVATIAARLSRRSVPWFTILCPPALSLLGISVGLEAWRSGSECLGVILSGIGAFGAVVLWLVDWRRDRARYGSALQGFSQSIGLES